MTPGASDIALRGRILVDWEIRAYAEQYGMIEPFEPRLVRDGVISYGLSSMGYDIRIADEFKIFSNINTTVVNPKRFDPRSFIDVQGDCCIIPPNSFALARTVEYFRVPPEGAGNLHRQVNLCPLRHRRQYYPPRVRVGGTPNHRDLQYHTATRENL